MNDLGKSKGFITFAAIALAVVLCASAVFTGVWFGQRNFPASLTPGIANAAETPLDTEGSLDVGLTNPGQIYEMPQKMSFTAQSLAVAQATGQTIDVRIFATVMPSDAVNKEVDYSIDWGYAPTHGTEPVTDYVTVTQDSDGSAYATVSCKKAFGEDKIIVTVITRDGGFTAMCTVSFIGKIDTMSLESSTLTTTGDDLRGNYYALATKGSYSFNINFSNVFGTVGAKNFTVSLGGSGELYFGTLVSSSTTGMGQYSQMTKKSMADIVGNFITSAAISENTLTITTGSKILDLFYFSSVKNMDDSIISYDRFVYYDEYGTITGDGLQANAKFNNENLEKCYFTVTVTDTVSGKSATIKIWLVASVTKVSLSDTQISF